MRLALLAGLTALSLATAAGASPREDRHFLQDALKGDNSEMTLGDMAARMGSSPALRDYGRTLHDDHARAKEDALRVATAMGVADTSEMMPEARAEARKLRGLRGRAFDREFARYMVGDHRNDIAEFRKAARGRGPTAELARRTLPDLEKHLQMARRLAG